MNKFNPFFINTNICLNEKDISTSDMFLNTIAHNTGNSYIAYALMKILFGGLIKPNEIKNIYTYDFAGQDKDIDFINNNCSHVFFVLQDQIRIQESYNYRLPFEQLIPFLKKIKKPLIITGLGANSFNGFDNKFHTKLSKELIEFLKLLSDKCESIGVRGYYTQEVLHNLKITNALPAGCPSFFETGKNRIMQKKPFSKDFKIVFSSPYYINNLISSPDYILQDEQELINLLYFNTEADYDKLNSVYNINTESLFNGKYNMFSDIDGWKEHLKKFDFVLGTRMHGAIISINSGTPAVVMNQDSRAREMSELFKIPYLPELINEPDISKVYEKADFSKMNECYNDLYDNFINWLELNNVNLSNINQNSNSYEYIEQPKLQAKKLERKDLNLMKINNNDLEIILITYNRKKHLESTLSQLFSEDSPIKDFKFTILDNKSTDGSSELIQEYVNKYPNIKHIRHNKNIGGNANITRAFEIAAKKYVWVLCDDDEYDWTHWSEVEYAVNEDYDLIVVSNYLNPGKNTPQLVKQLTFVPAGIYKTEYITDTVMVNANFNISNMFPQFAIFSKFINDNKRIYICKNWAVNMCLYPDYAYESYTRGLDNDKNNYMNNMFWQIGFLNSVQLIKDKKLRTDIIDNMNLDNKNLLYNFAQIFTFNRFGFNNSLKNLFDAYCAINFRQKIVFILAFLFQFGYFLHTCICKLKIRMTLLNFKTKKNIKNMIADNKGKKICLYGAGAFAGKFLKKFDLSELNILGIIDKNEEKRGTEICGYKIYSVNDLQTLNPEVLVLTVLEPKHCLPFIKKLKIDKEYNFNIIDNLFEK